MYEKIKKFLLAFWGNSLVHGALTGGYLSVIVILKTSFDQWQAGQSFAFPDIKLMVGAFIGGIIAYCIKNATAGSSVKPSINDKASEV